MRICLVIQFKGTHFFGWQFQPGRVTVQHSLEQTLSRLFNQSVKVMGCSRTDAGVHALMHVCHFDIEPKNERDFRLAGTRHLRHALNKLLPRDITILDASLKNDDFHANAHCKKKTYVYQILCASVRDPFLDEYVWHLPYPLKISAMQKGAKFLKGEHDFKAFAASDGTAKTSVRRVHAITCKRVESSLHPTGFITKSKDAELYDLIHISITASGFLKNMVRNIVGTLVEVGRGKREADDLKRILKSCDRRQAGVRAPAEGLFLQKVIY